MILQKMTKLQLSDHLQMADTLKVSMKVSWFDVKGKRHYQSYSLNEGEQIEF